MSVVVATATDPGRHGTFRSALSHRPLRTYLLFHTVISVAQPFGTVAIAEALYRQSGSATWVAAAVAGRLVPHLLASAFAGAIADRVNRHRLLTVTAVAQAAVTAVLLVCVLTAAAPVVVVALVTLASMCGTPCYPTVLSLVPGAVPPGDIAPASSLMNGAESAAWLIGPALGGLALVFLPVGGVLALNVALFAVGAAVLLTRGCEARASHAVPGEIGESMLRSMVTGAHVMFRTPDVAAPLLLVVAVNIVIGGSSVGMLLVADEILAAGEGGFGLLNAALGVGGFLGFMFANRLAAIGSPFAGLVVSTLLGGVPFALLSLTGEVWVAAVMVGIAGVGCVLTEVVALTVMLRVLPPGVLARAFGITDSLVVGSLLLGSLLAPALVALIGTSGSLLVVGAVIPAAAVLGGHHWRRLAVGPDRSAVQQQ